MATLGLAFALAGLGFSHAALAQQPLSEQLTYDARTQGPVPIPPSERELQSVMAAPWFQVSAEGIVLEGATFDQSGNMYFCDVPGRRVLRLTPDRQLSTVVTLDRLSPSGLAFHPDGRLFVAALDIPNGVGAIMAVNLDRSGLQAIIPPEARYMPNDLVFDVNGDSTSPTSRGPRPIRKVEFIIRRPISIRSDLCCRTLPWPTAWRYGQMARRSG